MTPLQVTLLMRAVVTLLEAAAQANAGTYLHAALQERIRDLREHLKDHDNE